VQGQKEKYLGIGIPTGKRAGRRGSGGWHTWGTYRKMKDERLASFISLLSIPYLLSSPIYHMSVSSLLSK
jgi:hypothetical protein